MRLLILGGTGILSTDFVKKSLDEGDEVWIINRGKRKLFLDNRAKLIIADLRRESVQQINEKINNLHFDVVVDFLSYNPKQLDTSLRILDGLFDQFIFISSATAYVHEDFEIISEDSTGIGNEEWAYSINKSKCENFLRNQDINYTIVRPYVTYGVSRLPFQLIPNRFHYTLIERIKNDKPVVLLNNGEAICTLTNTIDFANVLYKLLLNNKAYHQAYHITSSFSHTWRYVYEVYCELLEHDPNIVSVSLENIKECLPEAYPLLRADKGKNWRFDNSKVIKAIGGYEFKIDIKEGLKKSINFFENNVEMQGIDYKWDGKVDYMIERISGIKGLKCMESKNRSSSNKIYYMLMKNKIAHDLYIKANKNKYI